MVTKRRTRVPSFDLQFHDASFLSICAVNVPNIPTSHEIVGARLFINVFFKRVRIKALYDTGAAVSVINEHVFRHIRNSGAPVRPVHHGNFPRLSTASGSHMQILGIFNIEMTIAGRTFSAPLVVSPDIQNQCIIGMNIIRACGLVFDAQSETLGFHDSPAIPKQLPHVDEVTLNSFTPTNLALTAAVTIAPHTARLVTTALVDAVSAERIHCEGEYLADIAGIAVAFRTNKEGTCKLYVPNVTSDDMLLPRGEILGPVSLRDSTTVLTEPEEVSAITAKASAVEAQRAASVPPADKAASMRDLKLKIASIVNSDLPAEERLAYVKMLSNYSDVFSTSKHDIGRTDTVVHNVKVRDAEPVYTQQYRLPFDQLQVIRDHVGAWLKSGVIERANSKYNSPIFCVPKKEGQGFRPVLDYRKLNAKSLPDKYSIRPIDQCIEEVGMAGSTIFSGLDLKSGFWQMLLNEQARPYTAFTVPGVGQFQWVTAPMGLMGSPASFSRLMEVVMRDLANVITYIDDCLVHSRTHAEHLAHLEAAIQRLRLHGLKLNPDKCTVGVSKLQYLGHTLSAAGVSPGLDKTQAIRDSPPLARRSN